MGSVGGMVDLGSMLYGREEGYDADSIITIKVSGDGVENRVVSKMFYLSRVLRWRLR
jgi:hypothetical protein